MAAPGAFEVNVKDFNGGSYVIAVQPSWNVGQVRQEIARISNRPLLDFKIVFAGSTLDDHQTLEHFGIQGYSTLHCIRGRPNTEGRTTTVCDIDLSPIEAPPDHPGAASRAPAKDRFYVFCKKPCNGMTPGKLRVRCAVCKDTAFELDKGPGGWEDVLVPRKLQGHCNKEGCRGRDAEFFFKCANHSTAENEECVALHMVRANTIDVSCAICYETTALVVVFTCNHCVCVDCFKEYCLDKLKNRRFEELANVGYTVSCPAGCEGSAVVESHHFRMLGKELYDRYQRFGTEEFVLQMGGVLCPYPDCGMGLLPEGNDRRVHCPRENSGCGFTFCRLCKSGYHSGKCQQTRPATAQQVPGQDRELNQEALQRAQWVEQNESFIQSHTKPCPRCGAPVEKNGGCMHMTCTCRYQWCWICAVEWNRGCQSSHWFG